MHRLIVLVMLFTANVATADSRKLTADIWVDNWFELYVNGNKVIEDSVPITTERSFNAETITFAADLPAIIAIQAKDFKENDTGLEYIGTARQQMGDGGLIMQFKDEQSGETVAASDQNMRCLVIHRAPENSFCAEEKRPVAGQGPCTFATSDIPSDWTARNFDDSAWSPATEYSAQAVRPKDGYDRIQWDVRAKLVWSGDLVQDNTLLCRMFINE